MNRERPKPHSEKPTNCMGRGSYKAVGPSLLHHAQQHPTSAGFHPDDWTVHVARLLSVLPALYRPETRGLENYIDQDSLSHLKLKSGYLSAVFFGNLAYGEHSAGPNKPGIL